MYQRVLEDELEFPPEMDPYAMNFIAGVSRTCRIGFLSTYHVAFPLNIVINDLTTSLCLSKSFWSVTQTIGWEAKALPT